MRKNIIYSLLILIALSGCRRDDKASWDVGLNIPLLQSELGIDKLIADSLLFTSPDQSLTLVYRYSFYGFSSDSLFNMPDTISSKYFPGLPGAVIQAGQTIFNIPEKTKFNFGTAEVSLVDVKSGKIRVEILNTIQESVLVHYEISSATRNGTSFSINETIPGGGSFVKEYDISGYRIDFRGTNGLHSNTVNTLTSAVLNPNGQNITLTVQDEFSLLARFKDISVDYAKGFFGSESFHFGPDTANFSIFSGITSGAIDLEQVKLILNIENGFGLDARMTFNQIVSLNSRTSTSIPLLSSLTGKPVNISRASETGNWLSPVNPTRYSFDLTASNIEQFIENLPDKIIYEADVISNPLGNITAGNDFYYNGNYLNAFLDLEIPLSFTATAFTMCDTIDFNPGPGDQAENIGSGILTLLADNGFPFSAYIQIFLLSEDNQVTDTLFSNGMIAAAPLNSSLMAASPMRSSLQIPVSKEKINNLFASKKAVVRAVFNTYSGHQHIRIYDYYKLKLKLTGSFNFTVQQ
jgi:hypothetical protein